MSEFKEMPWLYHEIIRLFYENTSSNEWNKSNPIYALGNVRFPFGLTKILTSKLLSGLNPDKMVHLIGANVNNM